MKILQKLLSKFRKHKWDLDNPQKIRTPLVSYNKYSCILCGEALCLDEWQMRDLPPQMKYNCPGKGKAKDE